MGFVVGMLALGCGVEGEENEAGVGGGSWGF